MANAFAKEKMQHAYVTMGMDIGTTHVYDVSTCIWLFY